MKKYAIFTIMFFLLISVRIFAGSYYCRNVPDSSKIREGLEKKWFTQDLKHLRLQESETYENSLGQKFQVRLEELEDNFAVIVAPQSSIDVDIINEKNKKTVRMDIYPSDLAGSWILFRDKKNGNPTGIRWYFHQDSGIFVEFNCNSYSSMRKSDKDQKIYADFMLYDYCLVRSMPVGLTINQLYSISFVDLVRITQTSIPWEYTDIKNYLYEDSLQMIGVLQEKLEKLTHTEDACYDGEGSPVYVSTGKPRKELGKNGGISVDGFGFIKWIVDGLVLPITGSYLELAPLKKATVKLKSGSKADTFSDKYNMYIALDWTRNLAAAYLSVISGNNYTYQNSGCEVDAKPFASQYTETGIKNVPLYIKDSGYSVDCLKALFYVFAIKEPGRFYLGAIRETDDEVPQNIFYSRTAAFFPFFDEHDVFYVSVFENCKETSIEEFIKDNPDTFVNLVRLQSSQRFFPQLQKVNDLQKIKDQ
ncbi:MAG: hypothetical protein ACTTHG_03370 [Treponemataceae bacterium]